MPAKSRKQQRWAFAVKGEKWAREHHMDEIKKKAHSKKAAKQAPRNRKRT